MPYLIFSLNSGEFLGVAASLADADMVAGPDSWVAELIPCSDTVFTSEQAEGSNFSELIK